jgi:N-acetyl-beta-hexosaminidase
VRCPVFASRQEHPVNVYTLDVTNPLTLQIVQEMISQISQVFTSEYIHIGGDEVLTQCWAEDSRMVSSDVIVVAIVLPLFTTQ